MNRRRERRVLIVAMSPPKDLARVLLEPKWGWWWWGHGGQAFDHVDLLVSRGVGGVSQAGTGDVGGHHSVEKALSKLRRVFVVQVRASSRSRYNTWSTILINFRACKTYVLRDIIDPIIIA